MIAEVVFILIVHIRPVSVTGRVRQEVADNCATARVVSGTRTLSPRKMAFPQHADYAAAQNSVYEDYAVRQNQGHGDFNLAQNPGRADFTSAQDPGHTDYTTAQDPGHADDYTAQDPGHTYYSTSQDPGHADYSSWTSSYPYQTPEPSVSRQSQHMEWPYNELSAVKTEQQSEYDWQEMQHELQSLGQRVNILERRVAASGRCCRFCSRGSRLVLQVTTLENAVQPLLSRTVHWYLNNSMQARLLNSGSVRSDEYTIYGYSIRMVLMTRNVNNEVWLGMYLAIWPGPCDAQLEWPFRKPYTLSLIHPLEDFRSIRRRIDPRDSDQDTVAQFFERPVGHPNRAYGCRMATLESIMDCFGDGRLHLSLNVEI